MIVEKFSDVKDLVHELNSAVDTDVMASDVEELLSINASLIEQHRFNPVLGQCLHSLAETLKKRSMELADIQFSETLDQASKEMTLPSEVVEIIIKPRSKKEVKHLRTFLDVSRENALRARYLRNQSILDFQIPLKEVGITDLEEALAFIKTNGPELKYLNLTGIKGKLNADSIQEIVAACPNLQHLLIDDLSEIAQSEDLSCLGSLSKLKTLSLKNCGVATLPFLENLAALETLELVAFNRLSEFPSIDHIVNLKRLKIASASLLQLPSLDRLDQLENVFLKVENATQLPSLDRLNQLKNLVMIANRAPQLPYLDQLTELRSLVIVANGVQQLPSLEKLGKLTRLSIMAHSVTQIPSLENVKHLRVLKIAANRITQLPSLDHLPRLSSLTILAAHITQLPSFDGLRRLQRLEIDAFALTQLPSFNRLNYLKELDITAKNCTQLPSLDELRALHTFSFVSDVAAQLPSFDCLRRLEYLFMTVNQVAALPSLALNTRLKEICIEANFITQLPSLEHLSRLKRLTLEAASITQFQSFEPLSTLETLDLFLTNPNQIIPRFDPSTIVTIRLNGLRISLENLIGLQA